MNRRECITLVGGAAGAAWSSRSIGQPLGQIKRIAILHDYLEADDEGRAQIKAFKSELSRLGWVEGRNVTYEFVSGAAEADQLRVLARDLLQKEPDVVLGAGGTVVAALKRASRTTPIVFVNVTDPVGGGLVASLARPGGNATGFTQFEFGISAKWLELLKEAAPNVNPVAVVRDPTARSGGGQLGAIQGLAASLGMEIRPIDPNEAGAIEHDLGEFARIPNGGLIVTSSRLARVHRELFLTLADRFRLPAVYAFRVYVEEGGLLSYGPDAVAPYRSAATYVDRILKGEKAQNLPVQAPTKYELVVNSKAAKTIGLQLPSSLMHRADEVIE
jgi:putative ABC transport system substrate-binding protein